MAPEGEGDYPWYSTVTGGDIEQGDFIPDCPVIAPLRVDDLSSEKVSEIQIFRTRAVILSQSCDLVRDRAKVKNVILCPVFDRDRVEATLRFAADKWEAARMGRLPRYHVLNTCDLGEHKRDYSLVDLGDPITVAIDVIREIAAREPSRLRLNPPYREHMAQAFARFFMRVGLPVDIPRFV